MDDRASRIPLTVAAAVIVACGVALAAGPADEAWKAYESYKAAFAKATDIDELIPHLAAERAEQVRQTPADEKRFMFEMIKEMSSGMSELEVTGSKVDGDTVAFEVTGTQTMLGDTSPVTGTITMVKEGGAYKVSKEEFSSSTP